MVSDLACAHAVAEDELAARDDPAADARAKRDEREILRAFAAAVDVFSERGAPSIVEYVDALAELSLQCRAERDVLPLEVRRPAYRAGPLVDVARRSDADAFDLTTLERRRRSA